MTATTQNNRELFTVVHPLDDEPEVKVDMESVGPMRMTGAVRICLYALRAYLLMMSLILGYRVLQLAGVLGG